MSSCSLSSVELKALSVSASLKLLLCAECEVVLCSETVGAGREIKLIFPSLADAYKNLLSLCAARYRLQMEENVDGSGSLALVGRPRAPLLRYHDYLPGGLTLGEVLHCLHVVPREKPQQIPATGGEAQVAEFRACFVDYSQFSTEAALDDVHGLGFYLTLDCGLCLASHGHLVEVQLHQEWNPEEAVQELKEFSGWQNLDIRLWNPPHLQDGGIMVLPTIQDVSDLLEKYEDEDSDDEGDVLPFILRPVAPLAPVPCVEDSALRKLRDQHWSAVVDFWKEFPETRNTVVIFNLYPQATLKEILSFVEGLPIVKAQFVEDESPHRKRRVFITFETVEAARKALDLDGKSTKGRTLRVQVSPPYSSESRRGRTIGEADKEKEKGNNAGAASGKKKKEKTSVTSGAAEVGDPVASQKKNAHTEGEDAPRTTKREKGKQTPKMAVGVSTLHEDPAVKPPTAAASSGLLAPPAASSSNAPSAVTTPQMKPATGNLSISPNGINHNNNHNNNNLSPSPSMNAAAKEFVPKFHLTEPPKYTPQVSPSIPPPPPPAYDAVMSQQPSLVFISPGGVAVSDPSAVPVPFMLPPNAIYEDVAVMMSGILPPPPPPPPPPPRI